MTKLRDVCEWYKGLPHQDVALDWLEDNLPQGVMHVFLEKWRDAPPEPEVPSGINQAGLELIKEFDKLSEDNNPESSSFFSKVKNFWDSMKS